MGRVIQANQYTSTIEFIGFTQSGSNGISVYSNVDGKDIKGFLSSGDNNQVNVNNILKSNPVNIGDVFMTSGDDKIYPRDLIVGSVFSVHDEDTGTVKNATLNLNYDAKSLKYVYILKGKK